MPERVLRLFVSSPSDVAAERERVRVVADRLNGEFEGIARIDVQRWEDTFYTATMSFQQAIDAALDRMSSTDIVICVVWKRAGLKLNPAIWHRPDGSPYESGTVLEFESAIAASHNRGGVPDVYLFRKVAPVLFQAERVAEETEQHQILQAVLKRWTETPEGYNSAGSQPFGDPDDFEQKLDACLRQWLERRGIVLKGPVWDRKLKGSPFRGLDPFDAPHAPVFFGRDAAIERATARLRRTPFLLVLGVSGTGKSSLLRAGLLPRLVRPGVIPGIDLWRTVLVLPAADPLASLAHALYADGALGDELRAGDFATPQALTEALAAGGQVAIAPIRTALARAAQNRAQKLRYEAPRPAKLLLAIDQVERLFVEAEPARVETFAAVLQGLVEAGLATVIAALRSDAYGRFQQVEAFLALRETGETLDLPPSNPSELEDMVTRPVAACHPPLAFEADAKRRSLAEVLVADAKGGDALPLLQMTLQRLYDAEAARGDGMLRFADYPGMDAAVTAAAGEAFATLDEAARAELPALLTTFVRDVELAPAGGQAAMRILALVREDFERGRPTRTALVDAFIAHRLLTPEEIDGVVRVRPVHEALLRAWPEAVRIIAEHAALIRVRHTLEPMAADWARAPDAAKADYLVTSPALLAGAAQLPARFGDDLGAEMRGFIAASVAADARRRDAELRRQRRRLAATAAGLVIALALAALAGWQWREAESARAAAVAAERTATEQKEIAEAQRARAERTLAAATKTANALVFDLAIEFRNRTGIPIDLVRKILDRAQELQRQLAESGETSSELRRSEAAGLMVLVDTLLIQGDTKAALAAAERTRTIMEELTASKPDNAEWQRDLSLAHNKFGDVMLAQGRREEALASYRKGLAIREKLAAADPDNPQWKRDLSASHNRVGDVLAALGRLEEALDDYRQGLVIIEKLAATDPSKAEWQNDIGISHERIGDVLLAQGDLPGALKEYEAKQAIISRLAADDPTNAQWQRGLAITYNKIAGVYRGQGLRDEALDAYRKALAISEKLAGGDRGNAQLQRDLSFSYTAIADMLRMQDKTEEALEYYRKSLAIDEKLAAADPGNPQSQTDLVISLWSVADAGDKPRERFTRALEILRRLDAEGKLTAKQKGWIAQIEKALAELK